MGAGDWSVALSLAVVVITGHATPEEIENVRRLGAVDVIQKPSALTNYHRAIERLRGPARLSASEKR